MADLVLTPQQVDKIRRNRKETTARPKYYNSETGETTTISSDFEAFLILLDEGVKANAIAQLKNAKTQTTKRKDRDDVLKMALASELSDSQTIFNEVTAEFTAFDDFFAKFTFPGFETVGEVGQLTADLQSALGERLLIRDRYQHLSTLTELLQKVNSADYIKETKIKEIDSWITVITTYKGLK